MYYKQSNLHHQTSLTPLPDDWINAIAIDSQGNKWIGTWWGGLAKFDGTNWTVYNFSNSGLPGDYVRAIAIDSQVIMFMQLQWMGKATNGLEHGEEDYQSLTE